MTDQRPERLSPPEPFARELQRAIAERGVSLVWLRDRLAARGNPVSMATLSYWRSGKRRPEGVASQAVLSDLEELLDLRPGALLEAVSPVRRTAARERLAVMGSAERDEEIYRETLEAVGLDLFEDLHLRSIHVTVDIDEHGACRRIATRRLGEARRSGVSRSAAVTYAREPLVDAPEFRAGHGCHVARTYVHPSRIMFGAVLGLDRSLELGEIMMFDFEILNPAEFDAGNVYEHVVLRQCRELTVWIRFPPGKQPRWYEERVVVNGAQEQIRHTEVEGSSIFLSRRAFGPGEARLSWGF